MLKSLDQAKDYTLQKVQELTGEYIDEFEKDIIITSIEENFYEKIFGLIDEAKIEEQKLLTEQEFEGYLAYTIPNYTSILEETTTDFLSNYLSK